jgi:type VI secretion system secreted protein VgrG
MVAAAGNGGHDGTTTDRTGADMPDASPDRPLQATTPLGPDAVLLAGFRGREAVSELFAFDLDLLAPLGGPPVAFDALLGRPVTAAVRLPDGQFRQVNGIVTELRQTGRDLQFTQLTATVRPAWWPATLRVNSRIYQQVTAPDILKAVLSPFGQVEFQLTAGYPSRDFTCQYQETDWAFASRIMEEEGIFYYFRHAADGHTLVLADAPATLPAVPGPGNIRYDIEGGPGVEREVRCWRWVKAQQMCPTGVTVWDSHLELFGQTLAAQAAAPAFATAGTVTHRPAPPTAPAVPVYLHNGDYAKRYDGVGPGGGDRSYTLQGVFADAQRTARLRAEAYAAPSIRLTGETNAAHLVPGHTFALTDHFDGDGRYIVTAVEHTAVYRGTFRAGQPDPAFDYRNEITASPPDLTPRPERRTPRPKVGGPLTAIVVGPAGAELFVDRYGRIKVQFFWDREGQHDSGSSCWVRCSQAWAGKTWGAFFWPRVGMEVVVHFEDGDIDRPIITGCVYNATNMPPTILPEEGTVGGFKSCIFGGDPAVNFNAIYIHDRPGVEYIQVHSERSESQHSEQGKYHYTGGMTFSIQGRL